MSICHIFKFLFQSQVKYDKFKDKKGFKMAIIIENVETLFQRFENSIEKWATKVF